MDTSITTSGPGRARGHTLNSDFAVRHAQIIEGVLLPEVRVLPTNPSLTLNGGQLVGPGVVRIQNQKLHRVVFVVYVDSQNCVCQNAAT